MGGLNYDFQTKGDKIASFKMLRTEKYILANYLIFRSKNMKPLCLCFILDGISI